MSCVSKKYYIDATTYVSSNLDVFGSIPYHFCFDVVQGETSSLECAHQLGKLCENRHLVVNLIPYNATDVKDKLQCPSLEHMQKFRDIVASYGTFCTIRRTMGADIASACGQLVQKTKENEASPTTPEAIDIEDIVGGSAARAIGQTRSTTGVLPQQATPVQNIQPYSTSPPTDPSWLESVSTETLDRWTNGLAIAAAVSASCFVISTSLFLRRR